MTCGRTTPATRSSLPRRLASDEGGQILLMTGVLMVVMLVLVALVVDIGHTRLVQRQLQAGVDAAALAGALDLPLRNQDPATVGQYPYQAEVTAQQYGPSASKKNALNTMSIDDASTTAKARCITTIPGCDTRLRPVNALTVKSTADVPTFFARIIGIDSLKVSATATACFPCSVRPVDIMIVLDRTGSMCDSGSGGSCSSGVDLDAAKNGIRSFLLALDPKLDRVGLAVLPPALGPSVHSDVTKDVPPCLRWRRYRPHTDENCVQWTQETTQVRNPDSPADACAMPYMGTKNGKNGRYFGYMAYAPWWRATSPGGPDGSSPAPLTDPGWTAADGNYKESDRSFYVVSSLSDDDVDNDPDDDYVTKDASGQWGLNDNAPIVSTLDCIKAAGSTSYSLAIDEAAHELEIHGRGPSVPKAIVFFTDGAANTFPNPQANDYPSSGSPWKERPCGSGVEAAKRVPANWMVYTIGYDLDNEDQVCLQPTANGEQDLSRYATPEVAQVWGQTPTQALKAMASTSANFYFTNDPVVLQGLWGKIAGDVLTNAARLVDNNSPDLMD